MVSDSFKPLEPPSCIGSLYLRRVKFWIILRLSDRRVLFKSRRVLFKRSVQKKKKKKKKFLSCLLCRFMPQIQVSAEQIDLLRKHPTGKGIQGSMFSVHTDGTTHQVRRFQCERLYLVVLNKPVLEMVSFLHVEKESSQVGTIYIMREHQIDEAIVEVGTRRKHGVVTCCLHITSSESSKIGFDHCEFTSLIGFTQPQRECAGRVVGIQSGECRELSFRSGHTSVCD
mmetsp:Transcript_16979/g.50799  ORF Transcript_16979/g.50799 Transcript_16979/m.50799 type:complete len:227 (-) Transcript_16979:550-1230(-)